jgi:hypothetical protein
MTRTDHLTHVLDWIERACMDPLTSREQYDLEQQDRYWEQKRERDYREAVEIAVYYFADQKASAATKLIELLRWVVITDYTHNRQPLPDSGPIRPLVHYAGSEGLPALLDVCRAALRRVQE